MSTYNRCQVLRAELHTAVSTAGPVGTGLLARASSELGRASVRNTQQISKKNVRHLGDFYIDYLLKIIFDRPGSLKCKTRAESHLTSHLASSVWPVEI